ncbi:MAG: hypothetical protein KDB02_14835 [Acidimicrobiales bacterium]|nr:hypothetical protein [Acidimicrobiales bacterium]
MRVHGPAATGVVTATATRRSTVVGIGLWGAVIVAARLIGIPYVASHDTPLAVDAVPWVGQWTWASSRLAALVVAAIAGAIALWWLPVLVRRWAWPAVLLAVSTTTASLTWLLARASPEVYRWRSIQWGYGQHTDLVEAIGPAEYLRTYVEVQPSLGGHLRAHPPGFVLSLWSFERVGLEGTGFHLALMLVAGAVASLAALVAMRAVAGDEPARAAAPFVAIAPVLVWRTNPDVVFGAVALVGVALALVAVTRADRWSPPAAVAGGFVFALALMLSYGVALLALPVVAVAVARRAWRPLALVCLGGVAGLALPFAWGFWWLAGLAETERQYRLSLSRVRGYRYWLLGNAATFLGLIGPATVAALTRLRALPGRVLIGAAVACPILAGISGMSSAETERIWQPFVPLVLLAGAGLWFTGGRWNVRAARFWLAVQFVVAIGFQAFLVSPW